MKQNSALLVFIVSSQRHTQTFVHHLLHNTYFLINGGDEAFPFIYYGEKENHNNFPSTVWVNRCLSLHTLNFFNMKNPYWWRSLWDICVCSVSDYVFLGFKFFCASTWCLTTISETSQKISVELHVRHQYGIFAKLNLRQLSCWVRIERTKRDICFKSRCNIEALS